MNHPGIVAVAITFWIFVTVVSVAGIIQDYRKRQLALEPLRMAIEHGQQLAPELVARLLGHEKRDDKLDPQLLQVSGIITMAAGFGIVLLSLLIVPVWPLHFRVVLGAGVVALCVGVGLIVAAKALRSNAMKYPQDNVA
jgi:hypothetical protein